MAALCVLPSLVRKKGSEQKDPNRLGSSIGVIHSSLITCVKPNMGRMIPPKRINNTFLIIDLIFIERSNICIIQNNRGISQSMVIEFY